MSTQPTPARALDVVGTFRGATGYDHHTRALVHQLLARGVAVRLHPLDNWMPLPYRLPAEQRDTVLEGLTAEVAATGRLQFCLPTQAQPVAYGANLLHSMFEADRISTIWRDASLAFDLVAVPTESSRAAWIAGGVPEDRVVLSPLGVDAGRFHPRVEPLTLPLSDGRPVTSRRVRFLNVSDLLTRKNLLDLLAAWLLATRASDDAALIVKLSIPSNTAWLRFGKRFDAMKRSVGRKLSDAAPLLMIGKVLPEADMPGLFAAATHYLSLSLAEGWDLPMMEAAATGLRLIVPRHSAYADNLTAEIATFLPVRPVPAILPDDPEVMPFFAGARWWKPDRDAAVAAIRAAIDDPGEGSGPAREHITRNFSWTAAGDRLMEAVAEAHRRRGIAW